MAGLGIVCKTKNVVTEQFLKEKFPSKAKTIDENTVALINRANSDPEFNGDEFINQMITYRDVMTKNSASMQEYINALRFCAYLESTEDNYTQAYIKARCHEDFVRERMELPSDSSGYKELTFAASRYRKTPMVKDILIMADMPLYLMFQGARYQAVSVLATEMHTAMYSKDRIAAADKLLTHVKPPENIKVELDIGVKQENMIDKYEAMINQLVSTQKDQIAAGGDLKAIANVAIVHTAVDYEDAEIEEK
jgi:hypothetical protein